MTSIVPDSEALRAQLRALPPTVKPQIRARRHPWLLRPRMLILRSSGPAGDQAVAELVAAFGSCRWERGRWRRVRVQLALPGF